VEVSDSKIQSLVWQPQPPPPPPPPPNKKEVKIAKRVYYKKEETNELMRTINFLSLFFSKFKMIWNVFFAIWYNNWVNVLSFQYKKELNQITNTLTLFFSFFSTCPHKRGRKIRIRNFHFNRYGPNQLNYYLKTLNTFKSK
jgi:hypothetical protein